MNGLTPANRIADDFLTLSSFLRPQGTTRASRVPVEVWEEDEAFTIHAEVPGFDLETLELTFHDGVLTLKGERTLSEREGKRLLAEMSGGSFERALRFRGPIAVEGIAASYANGILTVTVPKAEEAKPRRIEIKTIE